MRTETLTIGTEPRLAIGEHLVTVTTTIHCSVAGWHRPPKYDPPEQAALRAVADYIGPMVRPEIDWDNRFLIATGVELEARPRNPIPDLARDVAALIEQGNASPDGIDRDAVVVAADALSGAVLAAAPSETDR